MSSGPYGKFAAMITATLSLQKRPQSFARGSNCIALTITRGGSNVISTNGVVPIPLSKEEAGHQGKIRKDSPAEVYLPLLGEGLTAWNKLSLFFFSYFIGIRNLFMKLVLRKLGPSGLQFNVHKVNFTDIYKKNISDIGVHTAMIKIRNNRFFRIKVA